MILSTEDTDADYQRKLAAIRWHLGPRFDADAVAENVMVLNLAGMPIRMVGMEKGTFLPTPVADDLAAVLCELRPAPDLVIMETVSRLAGGIETNESLSILVESAQRVCRLASTAVVLVTHMSQEAARMGATDAYAPRGGSALGDNGRSTIVMNLVTDATKRRWAPKATKSELGKLRVLVHAKSNGAQEAQPLVLERVTTPHAAVLKLADMDAVPRESNESVLFSLVETKTNAGVKLTMRKLTRTFAKEMGLTHTEMEELVNDALKSGVLLEAEKIRGGTNRIVPGTRPAIEFYEVTNRKHGRGTDAASGFPN